MRKIADLAELLRKLTEKASACIAFQLIETFRSFCAVESNSVECKGEVCEADCLG